MVIEKGIRSGLLSEERFCDRKVRIYREENIKLITNREIFSGLKSATSFSFPDLASSLAGNANFSMIYIFNIEFA